YTIKPINTGFATTSRSTYIFHHSTHKFYDVTGEQDLPVVVFLIEGNGHKILVDTGMSNTEIAHKYHHPGSSQPEGYAIYDQLEKMGVKCEEIDTVILTHLHWDHCYHLSRFTRAKFYVQSIEYEFAKNPIPLYHKSYEDPSIGLTPQFEGIDFELLNGETSVLDGISVYLSPGHSIGHQTVVVNTTEGEFHLCGDLVFTYDNFKEIPQIGYSITPPARFQDVINSWRSIEECKKRAASIDHILPTHEMAVLDRKVIGQ
ncbi:N-acyl homoserine lactonase family protein, partial [Oceanispirochaeta sp.]|uniref:N-acyl homoserine lactonase family protein n=1 Tax=Oceanispirochaeta sp. TaxID=2035350 RepID=UPI00345DCE14